MTRRKNVIKTDSVIASSNDSGQANNMLDFDTAIGFFITEQKIRNRATRTIAWHRENLHTLKVFLERQNIVVVPMQITPQILKEKYILYMLETLTLSPVTVNGRIRSCRAFFEFLHEEGHIAQNPAKSILPLKSRKTVIETFSREQLNTLLSTPDKNTFTGFRDHVMMLLLLETGIRVSELARIKLEDIRWGDGSILVLGKGNKERLVPFQSRMKAALRRYLSARGHVEGEHHVFLTIDNIPMSQRNIQERIQDYGKAAQIQGVRVSPHTFRHTFAKMYIKNGGDAFSLQAILGHTTLDMVRHYVNLFSSDVYEQHRKFSPLERLVPRHHTTFMLKRNFS